MTAGATSASIVPLAQAGRAWGAKAASLAWLIEQGYPVPDGIVVREPDDPALASWVKPGVRYAVRSSASVEDSPEHSFAGQFATVLDVTGLEAVRAAVGRVIGSRADERLRPYLEHTGVDPGDVRMCVIVQEMVDARASGVAFSRNPLTGLADVVIEAVPGTGESLVSGRATPERWVRHWGDWTQRPPDPQVPEAVVDRLADRVAAIAEARGEPADVEWSWDGSTIYLLQVRPLTVANVPVYSNRISREFLPGVVPPLVWSLNVPIVNGAWLDLFSSLVGPLSLRPDDLARQFAYRAYFNMGAVGDIFEQLGMPRDLLEVLMGVEGGADRPAFRPGRSGLRHTPRMVRLTWRVARYHRELDRLMPRALAQIQTIESRDLRALNDRALLDLLAELERLLRTVAYANIVAPLLLSAYGSLLRRRLGKRGIDAHDIDFGAGEAGLADYDPTAAIAGLAAELTGTDGEVRTRVMEGELDLLPSGPDFLERFGHVSDSGNDFSRVPWREDPTQVSTLLSVPTRTADGARDRSLDLARLSRVDRLLARRTARYRLERERVSYTYTRGYGYFRPIVREIARRLVERGLLDEVDDVFALTHSEMEGALRGSGKTDVRTLAQARRADMERLRDVTMPEVIFGDEFEPAPPSAPERQLSGIPSARGIGRGPARVVGSIGEAGRVHDGDVLVIPYSDVGWTPMLARAGGIVAESGGLLSHSSIVAREFGIPCVVGVAGAMGIPDGAVVRVDGFSGEVQWERPAGGAEHARPADR